MAEDAVHGRFGGTRHYQLIQASLHKLVDRYYEKNSRLYVENEELTLSSSIGSFGGYGGVSHAEKTLHPDVAMKNEAGEEGMESEKVILVECETRKNGLLSNDLRTVAYDLLRQRNQDRNELMIYLSFPMELKGDIPKPEWANDLWFFDVDGGDNG